MRARGRAAGDGSMHLSNQLPSRDPPGDRPGYLPGAPQSVPQGCSQGVPGGVLTFLLCFLLLLLFLVWEAVRNGPIGQRTDGGRSRATLMRNALRRREARPPRYRDFINGCFYSYFLNILVFHGQFGGAIHFPFWADVHDHRDSSLGTRYAL